MNVSDEPEINIQEVSLTHNQLQSELKRDRLLGEDDEAIRK